MEKLFFETTADDIFQSRGHDVNYDRIYKIELCNDSYSITRRLSLSLY